MHTDFSRMKHISHFVLEQEGLRPSQMTVRQARHILTHNLGGTITYQHKGHYLFVTYLYASVPGLTQLMLAGTFAPKELLFAFVCGRSY